MMLPRIVIKRSRSFFFLSVSRHFERTWITLTGINVTNCLESNLSVAGELKDTRLDSRACASRLFMRYACNSIGLYVWTGFFFVFILSIDSEILFVFILSEILEILLDI